MNSKKPVSPEIPFDWKKLLITVVIAVLIISIVDLIPSIGSLQGRGKFIIILFISFTSKFIVDKFYYLIK
ncbi:MAG: hypothetical protein JWN90_115 [Parcubacteria group bacterium]|nr:hypothetical protein [Parcubacteria group bacterium]